MTDRAASNVALAKMLTRKELDSDEESTLVDEDTAYGGSGSRFSRAFTHADVRKRRRTGISSRGFKEAQKVVIDLVSEGEEEKEEKVQEDERDSVGAVLLRGDPLLCCTLFRMIRRNGEDTAYCRNCGREEFHPEIREAPTSCFAPTTTRHPCHPSCPETLRLVLEMYKPLSRP